MKHYLFFGLLLLPVLCACGTTEEELNTDTPTTEKPSTEQPSEDKPIQVTEDALAFPGAEGAGMYATGGRGGKLYIVNSLADTNTAGTLRYAINQSGKRIIVFQVSGTIQLTAPLKIANGNLTIAGQTAPGDGICLAGHTVGLGDNIENVIIRYLRFRMGDANVAVGSSDGDDALNGRYGNNIIIDHCSMSWCTDECVSFYQNSNFTLQWCIISESLRLSGHTKGPHGYGGIWGGMQASFHHNLLAHHDSRNPRLGPGINSTKENERVDMRNNIIYNWCGNSCYGGEAMHVNIVNNYYKPGPATPSGTSKRGRIITIDKKYSESDKKSYPAIYDTWGQFYINGNVVDDGANDTYCNNATKDNWTYGVYNQFSSYCKDTISAATKALLKSESPFAITGKVTTHNARKAFEKVMAYAGCSYKRDAVDARVIQETKEGTASYRGLNSHNGLGVVDGVDWKSTNYPQWGIIDSQEDLKPSNATSDWSAWPTLNTETAAKDTDGDGMPDDWEIAHKLSPTTPNAFGRDLSTAYDNIEVYINSIVQTITEEQIKEAEL